MSCGLPFFRIGFIKLDVHWDVAIEHSDFARGNIFGLFTDFMNKLQNFAIFMFVDCSL